MAKYDKKARAKVKRTMHERKRGKLRSGRSGKKVKSRKQAIAIGLSQAREEGAKVPKKRASKKKKASRKNPGTRRGSSSRSTRSTRSSSRKHRARKRK